MSGYIVWAVAGLVLVIAELLTGTFYLLVLGVAALAGALTAYLGGGFWLQCLLSAAVALIGIYCVHLWRQKHTGRPQDRGSLDIGQSVVLDSWVNQAHGMAKVKYRGALWDAKAPADAQVNDVLYIQASEGAVLRVATQPS